MFYTSTAHSGGVYHVQRHGSFNRIRSAGIQSAQLISRLSPAISVISPSIPVQV